MQAAAPTRIMVESTTIPGVVVIQAGDTAAMAQRSDLDLPLMVEEMDGEYA